MILHILYSSFRHTNWLIHFPVWQNLSAHRVQNFFWREFDSNIRPRTRSCTWNLDWGNSGVCCVRPQGFSCLGFFDHYAFKLRYFKLINFWVQRCNLLHNMRHPIQTTWLNGSECKPTRPLVWRHLSAEDSSSPPLKRFLKGVGFEPTHTLVFQLSSVSKFLRLTPQTSRPSYLVFIDTFVFELCSFNRVMFSLQTFNLLHGLRHPFQKLCVLGHAFFCVSHASSWYLLFCAVLDRSATDHVASFCFLFLCSVILSWRSSRTEFVSWSICLIVFKTFSDRSGIRTLAHTLVPGVSTEEIPESGALYRLTILSGTRRKFWLKYCDFRLINFWIQRSNMLHSWRHPFQKIWRNGVAFKPTRFSVTGTSSAEESPSSRLKRYLIGLGFEPTHTRVYQIFRLRKLLSQAP